MSVITDVKKQLKMVGDLKKISITEMLSTDNGKSSMTLFISGFLGLIGGMAFAYGVVIRNAEIINNSVIITGFSASLLGAHSIVNRSVNNTDTTTTVDQTIVDQTTTAVTPITASSQGTAAVDTPE